MLQRLRRRGLLIFAIFAVLLGPTAMRAKAETINVVIFSWSKQYIEQAVDISSFAGSLTTFSAGATGKNTQGGPDLLGVELTVFDASSVEVYAANSDAQLASISDDWSTTSTYVDASQEDTSSWSSLRIRVWGKDSENWGGNYGPMLRAVSLTINDADQTSLLTNSTFSSVTNNAPDGWTSSQSWDTCQGLSTATLCVGSVETQVAPPETTTTSTTTTTTTVPPTTTTTLPPTQQGLEYWTFDSQGGSPAEPADKSSATTTGWVSGIDMNWGSGQILNTGRSDGVLLWFEGFIQPSTPETYDLYLCSDDGMRLRLNGELVLDNWYDRGTSCGGAYSADFSDGNAKTLKVSWYENGGGASVMLRYRNDSGQVVAVPESWYSYGSSPSPIPTTTTTTTIPQSIGAPLNLTVTETETGFFLDWDEPTDGNVSPERYAVSWSVEGIGGWGLATGNAGDESALVTEITVSYDILESTGGLDQTYVFSVRSDNDSLSLYSSWSNNVELLVSTPTTTTTLPPTTTTVPPSTTTTTPPTTTTVYVPPAPPPTQAPTTTWAPSTTSTPTTTTPTTTAPTTTAPVTTTMAPPPKTTSAPTTVVPSTAPSTTSLTPSTASTSPTTVPKTTAPATQPATTVAPEPEVDLTPDTPEEAVRALEVLMAPDAPEITPQQLTAIIQNVDIDAVPDAALVEIIASDSFEEVDEEVIVEVIEAIEYEELTQEQTNELVTALNETSDEVKLVFEDTVNVYSGQFDTYVPSGSAVTVGTRRVVVAVAAATIAAAAPAPSARRK